MDEREIEAATDALLDDSGLPRYGGHRATVERRMRIAFEAADRVRDARGDDERSALNQTCCSGCTEAVRDEEPLRFRSGVLWHEACLAARSPQDEDPIREVLAEEEAERDRWGRETARSPQGEDHEAGIEELRREARERGVDRWDAEALLAAYLARVSPSRVGSVAVEDVRAQTVAMLRENARLSVTDEARYFNEGLANKIERELSRSSTDRPEQPDPDALGGQPPAEPEEPKEKDERRP
jgi:hypothetical protein